ncbi:Type 1 glutamine amidotransferase-like domain-containing protein [Actinocorallia populi]|uniref:Type 1 glutamine amidotransferase-like domain-containing protein n=1 Tax=Actinocorallia populi TaxID=2079200 RepID=UPI000D08D2BD|nr:Type 1 glutamine amidotransferase-like domain-containing protein [Actinocorallia populi]
MRRLFLGSAGLGALPAWLASLPSALERVVFVPTAANPLPSAPFVDAAVRLLHGEGLVVERLDLEHADGVEPAVRDAQLVFVTGGYAMFLLQHARRTGFDRFVSQAVRDGRLAYAGISAGAALAGPDLRFFQDAEDPGICASTTGLDLVPFTVLPHRDRGRADRHDRYAARYGGSDRFISIDDDQAVVVEGDAWEVQASP